MYEEEVQVISEELSKLPENTVLTWGMDTMLLADGVHRASWIDVYLPEICPIIEYNWAWTVISDTDEDAPSAWPNRESTTIALAPDVTVYATFSKSEHWFTRDGHRAVVPLNEPASGSDMVILEAEALSVEGEVVASDAWTLTRVSEILAEWTFAHTGRSDIKFEYGEFKTPMLEKVEKAAASIDAGEGIDLGDGVKGSQSFMDSLLEMGPDAAADLMGKFKNIVRDM